MKKSVVCFGEVLLDVFPNDERIGGAPLNVASRISVMGVKSSIISRIGKDNNGRDIMEYLEKNQVNTENVQLDPLHPTGTVTVTLDNTGSATYKIGYPAAWDKIEITPLVIRTVEASDAFIFGSLACRDEKSRESLFSLLPKAKLRILDLNLRPPHYSKTVLMELMKAADFIKFNEEEILEMADMFGLPSADLETQMLRVAEKTATTNICVTKGGNGAVFLTEGSFYRSSGYSVQVKDTVGAGDSFLASLIVRLLQKSHPQQALDYACAIGSMVAGEAGANPHFKEEEIRNFMGKVQEKKTRP